MRWPNAGWIPPACLPTGSTTPPVKRTPSWQIVCCMRLCRNCRERADMKRVAFEVSLKPFWDLRPEAIRQVCREMFRQWDALHRHAERIAVMIWAADGSEILDYAGDLSETFEWAHWIGVANPRGNLPYDPEGVCLHSRPYEYRDNLPAYTYRDLALVVAM